jgi:hypothetical protein
MTPPAEHVPGQLPLVARTREELLQQLAHLRKSSLGDVAAAAKTAEEADAALAIAVTHARVAGASWADIGRACGITRQAAQQRWGVR